jgi:uncharacterized protein
MEKTTLGRTGLQVTRCAFGALPIQRIALDEAVTLLRSALDAGINFYDTARSYSDSEEKLGNAFAQTRQQVILATKTPASTRADVLAHIETSLRNLRTDHIDILQLHNPKSVPDPNDPQSSYAGLLEARAKGMTRFIGITNHSIAVARQAVQSGLFDTVQFPLSYLSSDDDLALVEACRSANVGLIAMKALCGGLLTNVPAAFAFLRQYANVVPIWGMQRPSELAQFVALEASPPRLDRAMLESIATDRRELAGLFCRGCGYCLPCPQGIELPWVARMSQFLRRAPWQNFMSDEWRGKMLRVRQCEQCGACSSRCPYGIDTPALIRRALADYEAFYLEKMGKGLDA